jgi:outer membrane protein assembly factor BamB
MDDSADSRHEIVSRRRYLRTTAAGVAVAAGLRGTDTVRADPGDLRWEFGVADSPLTGPPAVVDGTLYLTSVDSTVYAIDVDSGTRQWSVEDGASGGFPLTVADGTVYTVDGGVHALDSRLGSTQWTFEPVSATAHASPTVADGAVYVGSYDGRLYAIDAGSGSELWTVETGDREWSQPVVLDDTVYIRGGYEEIFDDDVLTGYRSQLYAVDARTGEKRWRVETNGRPESVPTLSDGTVFVCSGPPDGSLYALDSETGEREWSFTAADLANSSPTVAGGTVYVGGDTDSVLYAVDAASGKEIWRLETDGAVGRGSPTVVDGSVFLCTTSGLLSVATATGDVDWTYEIDADARYLANSSPVVVDGTVYVSAGSLYAVDAGVEGSSRGSRTLLGTLGHHDDWVHAGQQIQIHREANYTLDGRDWGVLGLFGVVTGGLAGIAEPLIEEPGE